MSFERETFSRDEDNGNYKTLHIYITRDKRVNCKARGVWFTVMSLPITWKFSIEGLCEILPDGATTVRTAISTLIETGYCIRTTTREHNRITGWHYHFKWSPDLDAEKLDVGFLDVGNQAQSIDTRIKEEAPQHDTQSQAYVRVNDTYVGTGDDFFANLKDDDPVTTPFLIDIEPKERHKAVPIPESAYHHMYRICYQAETVEQAKTLNSRQRGRVASALGQLREGDVDFNKLTQFETWWKGTWMAKNRDTGSYMPPRPEQVSEHWWTAMKAQTPTQPMTNGSTPAPTQGPTMADIERAMQARRADERTR